MHFLSRWFDNDANEDQPKISFGRFSDTYKGPDQYRAWDEAQIRFQDGEVIEAAKFFFGYLIDPKQKNVNLIEQRERLGDEVAGQPNSAVHRVSGYRLECGIRREL